MTGTVSGIWVWCVYHCRWAGIFPWSCGFLLFPYPVRPWHLWVWGFVAACFGAIAAGWGWRGDLRAQWILTLFTLPDLLGDSGGMLSFLSSTFEGFIWVPRNPLLASLAFRRPPNPELASLEENLNIMHTYHLGAACPADMSWTWKISFYPSLVSTTETEKLPLSRHYDIITTLYFLNTYNRQYQCFERSNMVYDIDYREKWGEEAISTYDYLLQIKKSMQRNISMILRTKIINTNTKCHH